jgi:hypothetical protein
VIIPALAEGTGEPRHPLGEVANRPVHPLGMAGANTLLLGGLLLKT